MSKALPLPQWQREYFSSGYKVAFLHAMELRMQAGERVGRALASVISAEPNAAKRRDMSSALEGLEQGETISQAISRLGFFDSTVLSILNAGERSGMSEAIRNAAHHLSIRQAWLRQHALVIFLLLNEMLSAMVAPVLLASEVLPWIRENIAEPTAPVALMAYRRDMQIAEYLTFGLIGLNLLLLVVGAWYVYCVRRESAPSRLLMFFSDGAMAVAFKLVSAMLQAGVTIESAARELALSGPGWARYYWSQVHAQLELAVEPGQALLQQGLYDEERALLASHANAQQLAQTLGSLSKTREFRAKRARDVLMVGATFLTMGYIFMTLSVAIWIYVTYDASLSSGLESLGSF